MKNILLAILLSSCASTPAAQKAIAERSVDLTTWGFYCLGIEICGLGYIQYRRNPQPWDKLQPAKIVVP